MARPGPVSRGSPSRSPPAAARAPVRFPFQAASRRLARRLGATLGLGLAHERGRGLSGAPFQGIRFRLGVAMAFALLPIVILSLFQAQAEFQRQDEARRLDLQLAAERSAAAAKARLDGALVLLQALSPEGAGPYCEPRLTALVRRLDGYDGLYRLSATGQTICASRRPGQGIEDAPRLDAGLSQPWFQRLRLGEDLSVARAPDAPGAGPALIVAMRAQRPLGAFDGAMAAVIPLSTLQPDTQDRALPPGSEVALTDGQGRIITATAADPFVLRGERSLEGWVQRARGDGSAMFEARDRAGERRVYAGAALAGRDVYVLLSAPAPGPLSWARLNPISALILPVAAWFTAFAGVMLFSERIVIRWLAYLERIAAIYARGRFSVRPVQAVNAPSEIRVLAQTLDELAESIVIRDGRLNASLAEKDALMREIHHRVKNNLQIISSLLSMQQRALTDPAARAAMSDTRQRIAALALIYRTLYQSEDLHRADAREFLPELVGQLVASEAARGTVVTSSVQADSLVVDPDKLAPLALWLVEAITNAQKHAFSGSGGDLKVRFQVRGAASVLEVEDDGPGASDAAIQAGVGRILMTAFARQLRGQSEIVPAPGGGALARMTFATPQAAPETGPRTGPGTEV